jgi:PLP dependent protein
VALFDVIETVDREKIAAALASECAKQNRQLQFYVQVNIGEEEQKGGCTLAELPLLLAEARAAQIPLAGLMCVPPVEPEPAPYFALLGKLADDHGLAGLSMGMSDDFETAITQGATHVRVGSALFGPRG